MRRNTPILVFLVAGALLATACTERPVPLQSDADPHLREELARIGFRPDMIVD